MGKIAIIGGTGLTELSNLTIIDSKKMTTPYGELSSPIVFGKIADTQIIFISRHGEQHNIPPHKVNYRANIWALNDIGVSDIIAVNAVGGITKHCRPARIIIPDQLIDYTWSREHSYYSENLTDVTHVDFTAPYCESLRQRIISTAKAHNIDISSSGTYGVTQGPRLETAAEITRLERDGCDIVGMTAMPEAVLARELNICYASMSIVANYAAGKTDGLITMALIQENLSKGIASVKNLLEQILKVSNF